MLHKLFNIDVSVRKVLLVFLCLFLLGIQNKSLGAIITKEYSFELFQSKFGLADQVINHIHKDSKRNYWISTNNGLCHFNGTNFHTYNTKSKDIKLPHNTVLATQSFDNGESISLYIVTFKGIVLVTYVNNIMIQEAVKINSSEAINYSTATIKKIDSTIFVFANNGFVLIQPHNNKFLNYKHFGYQSNYTPFTPADVIKINNKYLLAIGSKIYKTFNFISFSKVFDFKDDQKIVSGLLMNGKFVYAYGQNIFSKFDSFGFSINHSYEKEISLLVGNPRFNIESVACTNENEIWLGINRFGIITLNDTNYQKVSINGETNFEGSKRIHQIFFPKTGDSWIASDNGLYFQSKKIKNVQQYNKQNGYLFDNNTRTCSYINGNYYVATASGLNIFKSWDNTIKNQFKISDVSTNSIVKFGKDLYFGSNGGLLKYTKNELIKIGFKSNINLNRIWDIQIHDNILWGVSLNGELFKYSLNSKVLKIYKISPNQSFFCFYISNNDILIPGTGKVYVWNIQSEKFTEIVTSNSELNGVQFTAINKCGNNTYLIGTQGNGLLKLTLAKKVLLSKLNNEFIADRNIYSILIKGNKVFLGSENNIILCSFKNSDLNFISNRSIGNNYLSFGRGLVWNSDSTLMACGNNGISIFKDNDSIINNDDLPNIESIKTNVSDYNYSLFKGKDFDFVKGTKILLLQFSNPDIIDVNSNYWIKILGKVISIGSGNSYLFQVLSPGMQEIELAVTENENTLPTEWIKYNLYIDSFFYETSLFKYSIIIMLIIFLLIFLFFIWRAIKTKNDLKTIKLNALLIKSQAENDRLNTLRMQMNPHFLFNSLSGIQGLILQNKKEESINYVVKLSKLIRELFNNSSEKYLVLEDEINFITKYCQLQQLRYPFIKVALINDCNSSLKIPPMLLQPIIENVFTHAFSDFNKNCVLQIEFYETDNNLCISIEDNGVGFDNEEKKEEEHHLGISIHSIQTRLKTMFGQNHTFEMTTRSGMGSKIKIEIPKIATT